MKPCYRRAVAIEYQGGEKAVPTVVLQGLRIDADEIVRIARRFGIPVVEDPHLAKALFEVPIDSSIPERLYQAMAIVLMKIQQILNHSPSLRTGT